METARRTSPRTCLLLFVVLWATLNLLHATLLNLPLFWDELGQFVPQALDILRQGAWIPVNAAPNSHPPGVMAYLAAVWSITGYSLVATRVAMLAWGALAATGAFLLAIELGREAPGLPAFTALLLLLASPLFYMQSMMAQLDLPAAAATVWALWLFLRGRVMAAALMCVLLVLLKETGIWVPFLLGAWLARRRRWREAVWFTLPAVALAGWLLYLRAATGHVFGDAAYTQYNLWYPLHPVRLTVGLLRRAYTLLIADGQWIGLLAILWCLRRTRLFRTEQWALMTLFVLGHAVLVSVLGGATLERYLLPALPIVYAAMAAALTSLPRPWPLIAPPALVLGMIVGMFVDPPYPYPHENNYGMVRLVRLHELAAALIDEQYPVATIATAWPLTDALRRPEFGYVERTHQVYGVDDFRASEIAGLAVQPVDVLVIYSRQREGWLLQYPLVRDFLRNHYNYAPPATESEIQALLPYLQPVRRWSVGNEWVTVYAKDKPGAQPGVTVRLERTPARPR